jgi:hypothetical protein
VNPRRRVPGPRFGDKAAQGSGKSGLSSESVWTTSDQFLAVVFAQIQDVTQACLVGVKAMDIRVIFDKMV